MGDLSRHFSRSEFACKCDNPQCAGKQATPDRLLIVGLEELRERLGDELMSNVRIHINSGCRCPSYDSAVRHKDSTGQHAYWRAADVRAEMRYGDDPWAHVGSGELAACAERCVMWSDGWGGIGIADSFVHLDVRPGPGARWTY
jgi:hypothetical protein